MQRAFSLILLIVFLVTGPVHAAANKKSPNSFNFLRLKSSTGVKAPLVIEPGVLTPSSEDGAIEFDGNDLYITKSGVKTVLGSAGTKGEKGDKGDTGERGPRGVAGPSGPSGPAGTSGATNAAGSNGQIQFNRLGSFAGNGNLFWDFTNKRLGVGTSTPAQAKAKIVIGSAAEQGLVLQAAASQTGNLTEWRDSTGAALTAISSTGRLSIGTSSTAGVLNLPAFQWIAWGGGALLKGDGTTVSLNNAPFDGITTLSARSVVANVTSASAVPIIAKAAASQTANLTEWQNSAGTVLASVDPSGAIKFSSSYILDTAAGFARLKDSSGNILWYFNNGAAQLLGQTILMSGGASSIELSGNGTRNLLLNTTSGGNVGIGTASPARSLHISDTMRLQPRATAPTSPSLGDLYVDSDTNELCFYDGSTWTGLKAGGACS